MQQKAAPILTTSLLLGIFFNWFFVGHQVSLSFPLYCLLVLILTHAMVWSFRASINRAIFWIAPAVMFFSTMVVVRANEFLAFINTLTVLYLLGLGLRLMRSPHARLRDFDFMDYLFLPKQLLNGVAPSFTKFFKALGSSRKTEGHTHSYTPVIRGALYAAPILALFLILLSSADLVFSKYITSVFHPNISPEVVFRIGVIGLIASIFIGAFAYIFLTEPQTETEVGRTKHVLGSTESFIIMGSVATLFFIFVAIQSAYLFGGQDNIVATGYTYAQYARKGFFELIAVAVISLLLMGTLRKITYFKDHIKAKLFKILSTVLVAEVLIIMYSAHMRLNLYEAAYGFTTLRLLSHLSLVWLAYAFGQLVYGVWKQSPDNLFAYQLFMSGLCFIALLSLLNPDAYIARRNIARLNQTSKIDIQYLATLSEDATPAIMKLLHHPNKNIQNETAHMLFGTKYRYERTSSWQEFNVSRERARAIFKDNKVQINAANPYDTTIKAVN